MAIPLSLVLNGFLQAMRPLLRQYEWLMFAMTVVFGNCGAVALTYAAYHYHSRHNGVVKYCGACLVLTPDGMAMIQGGTNGEMRWNEVTGARLCPNPQGMKARDDLAGIFLNVGGIEIPIADTYDAPLEEIFDIIATYRRRFFR